MQPWTTAHAPHKFFLDILSGLYLQFVLKVCYSPSPKYYLLQLFPFRIDSIKLELLQTQVETDFFFKKYLFIGALNHFPIGKCDFAAIAFLGLSLSEMQKILLFFNV